MCALLNDHCNKTGVTISYCSSLSSYQIIRAHRKKAHERKQIHIQKTFASNLDAKHINFLTRKPQSWDHNRKSGSASSSSCHKSRSLMFLREIFLKKRMPFTGAEYCKGRNKMRCMTVSLPTPILLPALLSLRQ